MPRHAHVAAPAAAATHFAEQPHIPVDPSVADQLGNPRCAFVTGGPREYLPGINCLAQRLTQVGSLHPLLVMVEPEDAAYMQQRVELSSHRSSAVLPWRRFPDPKNRSEPWRFRSAHVMDKMNLFGMPFRRLVWIDADVFIRRSVDELCDLPDDVPFASGLDAEGLPTKCLRPLPSGKSIRASCDHKNCSVKYDMKKEAYPYVGIRARDLSPQPGPCPYILQSGVMVLRPFSISEFNEIIVDPMRQGKIFSYDFGDQGILASLTYGPRQLFGDNYMRLHPMYNVIARHAKHSELTWGGGVVKHNLTAALMHFTRETRPWQLKPMGASDFKTRRGEYTRTCSPVVCRLLEAGVATSRASSDRNPTHEIHPGWKAHCLNATASG